MKLNESINLYETSIANTRAKMTARTYRTGMARFSDYLTQLDINVETDLVSVLTIDHFIHFPDWLGCIDYAKATKETYMAGVSEFLNWLIIRDYITASVTDMLRYKKSTNELNKIRSKQLPRTPTQGQVIVMLESVKAMEFTSPTRERNIAILEFFSSSGCRVGEVSRLRIQDINIGERSAIVTGKGNKERIVFFSNSAALSLMQYWTARNSQNPKDPAFSRHDRRIGTGSIAKLTPESLQNIVRSVADFAGIENFTPHVFRHGFATEMLEKTGNIAAVQDLLGHSDPASTRVYAKIRPTQLHEIYKNVYD